MSLQSKKSFQLYLNTRSANQIDNPTSGKRNRILWNLDHPVVVPEGYEAHVNLVTAEIFNNLPNPTNMTIDQTTDPLTIQIVVAQYATTYGATTSIITSPTQLVDAETITIELTASSTAALSSNLLIQYGTYTPAQLAAIINGKTTTLSANFANNQVLNFTLTLGCTIVSNMFNITFSVGNTIQQNPTPAANSTVYNYHTLIYGFKEQLLGFTLANGVSTPEFWNGYNGSLTADSRPWSSAAEKYILVKSNLKAYNQFTTQRYLAKIPLTVPTGYYLFYQNPTTYAHQISDRSISTIELSLHQEDGEEINLNYADWSVTLQFDFTKVYK